MVASRRDMSLFTCMDMPTHRLSTQSMKYPSWEGELQFTDLLTLRCSVTLTSYKTVGWKKKTKLESPDNKKSAPITKIAPNLVKLFIKNVFCLLVVLVLTKNTFLQSSGMTAALPEQSRQQPLISKHIVHLLWQSSSTLWNGSESTHFLPKLPINKVTVNISSAVYFAHEW